MNGSNKNTARLVPIMLVGTLFMRISIENNAGIIGGFCWNNGIIGRFAEIIKGRGLKLPCVA